METKSLHYETHNLGKNIWRLFLVFAQFLLTSSETGIDFYQQKLGNFKKILGMLGFDDEYLAGQPKAKF